jgi:uncharacterized protein YqjF (DUF2071 family)
MNVARSTPRAFLTADWRYLAMLNYEIDPGVLVPLVPEGTELDEWQGRTFVSLVGFLFLNTRVYGLPIPFHRNFEEINLRFYVRRVVGNEVRRGVVFVKEIVPRHAIALTARYLYNENYVALPTRHVVKTAAGVPSQVESVRYSWNFRGEEQAIEATTAGGPEPLVEGTEPEFIAQHYWGYVMQKDGGTVEYGVEHEPWRAWQTQSSGFIGDGAALYGERFAGVLSREPSSAFVAEGSPITVRQGVRLPR